MQLVTLLLATMATIGTIAALVMQFARTKRPTAPLAARTVGVYKTASGYTHVYRTAQGLTFTRLVPHAPAYVPQYLPPRAVWYGPVYSASQAGVGCTVGARPGAVR